MRVYKLDPNLLEPFEIGARLTAVVAFPGAGEDEARSKAEEALCAKLVRITFETFPETTEDLRERFPLYYSIDPKEAGRRLRTLRRRLDDRMIAGRMSLGFLEEAITKKPPRLPDGMPRLSLNELSKLVQREARQSDPENVERRVWRQTLPVIHLAAAYQVLLRGADGQGQPLSQDLQDLDAHRRVVSLAQFHEEVVLADERFNITPENLVRLRWEE